MVDVKNIKNRVISGVQMASDNNINVDISNMNTGIDTTNGVDTNNPITNTDIDNQYKDTDAPIDNTTTNNYNVAIPSNGTFLDGDLDGPQVFYDANNGILLYYIIAIDATNDVKLNDAPMDNTTTIDNNNTKTSDGKFLDGDLDGPEFANNVDDGILWEFIPAIDAANDVKFTRPWKERESVKMMSRYHRSFFEITSRFIYIGQNIIMMIMKEVLGTEWV